MILMSQFIWINQNITEFGLTEPQATFELQINPNIVTVACFT